MNVFKELTSMFSRQDAIKKLLSEEKNLNSRRNDK